MFLFGIGIGDDARTGEVARFPARVVHNGRADGEVEFEAVAAEPADGAAIRPARFSLQLSDDLHGANLRRAGNRTAWKSRGEQFAERRAGTQLARNCCGAVKKSWQLVNFAGRNDTH